MTAAIPWLPVIALIAVSMPPMTLATEPPPGETVVLLHGLGRTHRSMLPLEKALVSSGFDVVNIDYPSRKHTIQTLAKMVADQIESRGAAAASRIHFVTHSLGGILVRWLHEHGGLKNLGRVVMISPPNQGSEIVDRLSGNALVDAVMGPAFHELGTGRQSVPVSLGPVNFELGVITGTKSLNPLFSNWVAGEDDGKVSTESAKVDGMADFLALPHSHAFIVQDPEVMDQAVHFLKNGRFDRPTHPVPH